MPKARELIQLIISSCQNYCNRQDCLKYSKGVLRFVMLIRAVKITKLSKITTLLFVLNVVKLTYRTVWEAYDCNRSSKHFLEGHYDKK